MFHLCSDFGDNRSSSSKDMADNVYFLWGFRTYGPDYAKISKSGFVKLCSLIISVMCQNFKKIGWETKKFKGGSGTSGSSGSSQMKIV